MNLTEKTSIRVCIVALLVCFAAAVPSVAGAAGGTAHCSSGQVDIGSTCTARNAVAAKIRSITRSVMKSEDAKGVILRVDVGNDTVVNQGFGISQIGAPVTADMKFRPGSMAIPMLTTIALQLQQQGPSQSRRHALEVVSELSQCEPGDVAHALERHVRVTPTSSRRILRSRLRSLRSRSGSGPTMSCCGTRSRCRSSVTPARASTTRTPTSSCWAT